MRNYDPAAEAPRLYRCDDATLEDQPSLPREKGDIAAIVTIDKTGSTDPSRKASNAVAVVMASDTFRTIVGLDKSFALPGRLDQADHVTECAVDALADAMRASIAANEPMVRPFSLSYDVNGEKLYAHPWATLTPISNSSCDSTVLLRIDTRLPDLAAQAHVDFSKCQGNLEAEEDISTRALQHGLRTLSIAYAAFTWETDSAGILKFLSDGVRGILGYSADEMLGCTPSDFMPPGEPERVRALLGRHPEKLDMPLDIEHRFLQRDGREIWVRVVMIPLRDPVTGDRRGHHGLTVDITDRKEAEAALNTTLVRHRALFEAAHDAILITDRDTKRVLEANNRAASITGHDLDSLVGMDLPTIFAEQDHARLQAILDQVLTGDGSVDDEIATTRADGSTVPAALRATSVTIDGRTVIQLIIRTLEDRVSYERQLKTERYAAQAANRSKTDFLANMSHELRTPLNAIIGFSEVLEQEIFSPLTPKQKDYVNDILESGRHLLEIINSILDLSKIEVGKFELAEAVVDFGEIAGKSLTLVRERAIVGGVRLEKDVATDIPYLKADPVRLKQILLNLLSNAVKFTAAGGVVKLSASVEPQTGDLIIIIADTGIGMGPDEITRAMQPFTQVHGDRNRSFEGTGLGLSLAQRLCQQHEASLEIVSEPSVGTNAIIRIPSNRMISVGDVTPRYNDQKTR